MVKTLVSPGVSVSLTDESFYATAGVGTIPLIVIATAENKIQPGSTTALASGTVKSDAGNLRLITSQRDAIQTYGTPKFYTVGGTPQYDNELNELGLFALYDYLGIANSAYVLRADVDLDQLAPSTTEPVGSASNGDYWLDLSQSTYGIFKSTGGANSSYAWQAKTPTVLNSKDHLEKVVQGFIEIPAPLSSSTQSVITANGVLRINNISIALKAGDTLPMVVSKINASTSLKSKGISAVSFIRNEKFYPNGTTIGGVVYGDVYNLRLVVTDIDVDIILDGSTTDILYNLGLYAQPTNWVLPKSTLGESGDLAIDVVTTSAIGVVTDAHQNQIWQKVSLSTSAGTTSWWFLVGSTDAIFPGWGWRESTPRVLTGTVPNPSLTVGEGCNIAIGTSTLSVNVPAPVGSQTKLDAFIAEINSKFNTAQVKAVAKKKKVGSNNYLQIVNYDATDVYLHDYSSHTGIEQPLGNAGISTSTTFFGSIQGTVSNPSFTTPDMFVGTATVVEPGTNYFKGEVLTVDGGVGTSSAQVTVATVKVASATITSAGSGYSPRDTLTLSGGYWLSPVVIRVDSVGTDGAITYFTIIQQGQFNNATAPTDNVAFTATSGSGHGATFNLVYGASTVTITSSGQYSYIPGATTTTSADDIGHGCTLLLTPDYTSADSFTMNLGSNVTKTIFVPGGYIDNLVMAINDAWPEYTIQGIDVASKVTSGSSSYLKITNPNGTNFILKDVSGTPLKTAGIPVGYTFGKQLVYKGYSYDLQVPNKLADIAIDNIWINTTPQNRGASFVVKQYQNGSWVKMNTVPNQGIVPMYSSEASADTAFDTAKGIGTVFMHYNANGTDPSTAQFILKRWDGFAWLPLVYTADVVAPSGPAANGTHWFNTDLMVDLMVSDGQVWRGYANIYPGTDPNGPILDASAPLVQSTGAPLVDYDIWIETSDIENYPRIYRYNRLSASWVLIDNTDHSSSAGIIFADARPNYNGKKTGSMLPSQMITSDYVDPDAPNAELYPDGLLLFNTRYSTNNVKTWTVKYFDVEHYPDVEWRDRWVTLSGNKPDGTPYMGHWAQRQVVVTALKSVIVANQDIRAEQTTFNLIACPGYVETLADLVTLNTDKKEVAFVIADTPARLDPSSISIQNWASNSNGAPLDGQDGLITHNKYAGIYYPWGLGTNIDGTSVFVPPSAMVLRTYAYNDQVAYPWFAPAGYNRGVVTGISSVGYLTTDNTYQFLQLSQGQRDVLYLNSVNPIAFIPNRGLIVYGQKTLAPIASAPDRINVARLLNYLNYQLDLLAKPFLFEPNDEQTRKAVKSTFDSFMGTLVGQRALYDFAVVCDDTNNTAARIDANQLWIDIAIKPEKAIEFIYIPIRLLNTGDPLPGSNRGTG
jgi:hypothetical protein